MRTRSITYLCVTILLSLILINSCSDSVESDPAKDNDITITLNPINAESGSTLSDAIHYVAESSNMIGVGADEVTRPQGTDLTVRTERDDYKTTETDITFDREKTVDIPMMAADTTNPDAVTITVLATDDETGDELNDLTFSVDGEIVSAGVDRIILTEPQDTTIDLTIEQNGYEPLTESILFDEDKQLTFELVPETAEMVTITYSVRDNAGQSIDTAELTVADTLVAEGATGSFVLPYSESEAVTVCGGADWYEDNCAELTPDVDQAITLILPRETVTISVTPEIIDDADIYANLESGEAWDTFVSDNTIYYLSIGDSTRSGAGRAFDSRTEVAEGVTTTIEYPAGPDPVGVSVRAEYFPEEGHPFSENYYLNVAEGRTTVAGIASSDVQLNLEHIPACRDEVDNDFTGVMDEEAPGCIDYDASTSHEVGTDGWVYEPDDDVELLQAVSISGLFGGSSTILVSSDANNQKNWIGGSSNHPESFQFAIGPIDLYLKNKIEKIQNNEEFAVRFVCGETRSTRTDTTGTTDIVSDDASIDGWRTSKIDGVNADFFSSGLSCGRQAIHKSYFEQTSTDDGDDDVVFAVPDTSGSATLVGIFEPEMAAQTTSHPRAGFSKAAGENTRIQDVRTSDPRKTLRALDPRKE